jgi:hypothetical protein
MLVNWLAMTETLTVIRIPIHRIRVHLISVFDSGITESGSTPGQDRTYAFITKKLKKITVETTFGSKNLKKDVLAQKDASTVNPRKAII